MEQKQSSKSDYCRAFSNLSLLTLKLYSNILTYQIALPSIHGFELKARMPFDTILVASIPYGSSKVR
jgi:hypothetical protein